MNNGLFALELNHRNQQLKNLSDFKIDVILISVVEQ